MSDTRKVQIISPVAGHDYEYKFGDLPELPNDVADAWVEAGLAREAPEGSVAAETIEGLQTMLADEQARVAALESRVAELETENASLRAAPPAASETAGARNSGA